MLLFPPAGITIHPVRTSAQMDHVIALFKAYADSLEIDLSFQNFSSELASMPGSYASPSGELFLASTQKQEPLGCIALRAASMKGWCEMKRLYVLPSARGMRLGAKLIHVAINEAKRIGYHSICLDTLPSMKEAIALYKKLGFEVIAPYYDTPHADTVFLGLHISPFNMLKADKA